MAGIEGRGRLVPGAIARGKGHVLQPRWDGSDSLRERFEAVSPLLEGSVLDVGCASRYGRQDWLHGLIAEDVLDLVGIDVNEEVVATLQGGGYDVRLADARSFDLGRCFDTAFAGELIEHLDDVRGFLTSVRRHLDPGGRIVLTTPNAFYVGNFVYRLGGHGRVHHEHTASVLRRHLAARASRKRVRRGAGLLHRPPQCDDCPPAGHMGRPHGAPSSSGL